MMLLLFYSEPALRRDRESADVIETATSQPQRLVLLPATDAILSVEEVSKPTATCALASYSTSRCSSIHGFSSRELKLMLVTILDQDPHSWNSERPTAGAIGWNRVAELCELRVIVKVLNVRLTCSPSFTGTPSAAKTEREEEEERRDKSLEFVLAM